jgi:hypothetical protein
MDIIAPIDRHTPVNASQVERWLGPEAFARLQQGTKNWYGPPIAVAGIPGRVYAGRDGTFTGKINVGGFASAQDKYHEVMRRIQRSIRLSAAKQQYQMNAGFASLGDLISEATTGAKRRAYYFAKTTTSVTTAARHCSHWSIAGVPGTGATAAAAPGGTAPTDATAGAHPFTNPSGGDTQHFVSAAFAAGAQMNLLLYDRIFAVTKTASSTATEAVTGVPTRYVSSTVGAYDYAGGNFCMVEVRATLGATVHSWTVCQYTDQDNNAAATFTTMVGVSGSVANTLDHAAGEQWFLGLASGDTGIRALTQMQNNASVTGTADFALGHPIVFIPCMVANAVCSVDGINTAFSLERIFDDAALATMDIFRPAAAASLFSGQAITVAG